MSGATREIVRQAGDALDRLRSRRPRVHCLTNTVVQKLTADGLSALGAIPSMTDSPDEVEAFVARADALLINLGTLHAQGRTVIEMAAAVAARDGKPIVLDPVFCDVSPVRLSFARALLHRYRPLLRANMAEMAVLDVPDDLPSVRTGAVDLVQAGGGELTIANGHPWMAVVVGTGCLSGAIIAAFLAVEGEPSHAAAGALLTLGIAAEIAAETSVGPGTFAPALLDALAALDGRTIAERARIAG